MAELPTFAASAYGANTSTYDGVGTAVPTRLLGGLVGAGLTTNTLSLGAAQAKAEELMDHVKRVKKPKEELPMRRLIRVIIADPNENVPLDKAILYNGQEQFTDLTDQELFFELPVKELLDKHNKDRVTWRDKSVKDRTEMLPEARVRDLRMTVVTITTF